MKNLINREIEKDKKIYKDYDFLKPSSVDEDKREITLYASTIDEDRYGDIVEPTAFDIKQVPGLSFLLNHSSNQAIGKGLWGKIETIGLLVRAYISDKTQLAKDTFELVKEGIIGKASIGFIPIEYEKILDDKNEWTGGFRFKKVDLVEISFTPTSANPGAVILALKSVEDPEMISLIKSIEDKVLMEDKIKTLENQITGFENNLKEFKGLLEKNNNSSLKELNLKTNKDLVELKKTVFNKLNEVADSLTNLDKRTDYKNFIEVINKSVEIAVNNYLGKV
jgi:HK97 family phage prohead protease